MEIKFDKKEVKKILIDYTIGMLSTSGQLVDKDITALESYGNFTVEITDREPVKEQIKEDVTDAVS